MVVEVNSNFEGASITHVESDEHFPKVSEILTEVVQKLFESCGDDPHVQLDPKRATNVANYLLEQVETIQVIEKLYLSTQIKRQENDVVKEQLLQLKERPDGFITAGILLAIFSSMAEDGNTEIMDFILAEFNGRFVLDNCDCCDAILAYAKAGSEDKAISMLDHFSNTTCAGDLVSLLREIDKYQMDHLNKEISSLLEKINSSEVAS